MNAEETRKLRALMLNKVSRLPWYYFDLNLNQRGAELSRNWKQIDIGKFLGQIKESGESFTYEAASTSSQSATVVPDEVLPGLLQYVRSDDQAARKVLRSIFDANEPSILNNAKEDEGVLGKLNEKTRKKRQKRFFKKMRKGFRSKPQNMVILAEGDSWFQFPKIFVRYVVKDIVYWLMRKKNVAIYSLAAGGDWLSNMIHSGEYIEALPRVMPDVFLFSGGGNDMLGNHRLANMIRSSREGPRTLEGHVKRLMELRIKSKSDTADFDPEAYEIGLLWLRDEFFQFLNLCFTQYFLLISELNQLPRYQHMVFFTQGYDFAQPTPKRRGNWISLHRAVNGFMNTGKWLYDPLMTQGITDPKDQKAILYAMITEFNEMLMQLARYDGFSNLYHIDCRGIGGSEKDWFDEIHLRSPRFEEIAEEYYKAVCSRVKGCDDSRLVASQGNVYVVREKRWIP